MDAIYTLLYWVHVPVAVSCIPAFWIAVLTKKGGSAHVRVGRWFAYGMMFVALTAFGVFFVGQLLGVRLPGAWQMAPWILPTIVGVPAMVLWIRAYERKFETGRS